MGRDNNLHAVWCRAYYLRQIRSSGQKCAVYADDDVYLDLDALRTEMASRGSEKGEMLVTAGRGHGMKMHINAGFVVFTDLQGEVGGYVSEAWYAMRGQPEGFPYAYLRDQMALNRLVRCGFEGVVCYKNDKEERMGRRLGLVGHCFSVMEKREKGAKERCMKRFKGKVKDWDAEVRGKRRRKGET